jgi:hypothetical protein
VPVSFDFPHAVNEKSKTDAIKTDSILLIKAPPNGNSKLLFYYISIYYSLQYKNIIISLSRHK